MTSSSSATNIFKAQGDNLESAGIVRVMADFSTAAYNLNHPGFAEDGSINDLKPYSTAAYSETIN